MTMIALRRRYLAAGLSALGLGLIGRGAVAQDSNYPARPVRVIVPFGAGGTADLVARLVAEHLTSASRAALRGG